MSSTSVPPASRRADLVDGSSLTPGEVLAALFTTHDPPPKLTTAEEKAIDFVRDVFCNPVQPAPAPVAAPPPAAPPPPAPYQAGVSVGPVKAVASGPDPWKVLGLLAGAVAVGFGGVALVRHVDTSNRRASARERREDQLVAGLIREDMALKAAKRAAKGPRGRV
jgi:hypothetical protein